MYFSAVLSLFAISHLPLHTKTGTGKKYMYYSAVNSPALLYPTFLCMQRHGQVSWYINVFLCCPILPLHNKTRTGKLIWLFCPLCYPTFLCIPRQGQVSWYGCSVHSYLSNVWQDRDRFLYNLCVLRQGLEPHCLLLSRQIRKMSQM